MSAQYIPNLKKKYTDSVAPALKESFGYSNVMETPKIEKIIINVGVGRAVQESKLLDEAVYCLEKISGQKPVVTKAKKAISNFKLREGVSIGCMVTLRGTRMYEFFERLISIAVPRIRDFRGLSKKCFDGKGNYTLGIKENLVFLEIDRDKISKIQGLSIAIVTSAKTDAEGLALLTEFGMPFKK